MGCHPTLLVDGVGMMLTVTLLASAVMSVAVTPAEPAGPVWNRIVAAAPMNGSIESGDWTFVSATSEVSADTGEFQLEGDEEFLKMDIMGTLAVMASPRLDSSVTISAEGQHIVLKTATPTVTLRGLTPILTSRDEDVIRVVMAIPTSELSPSTLTRDQLVDLFNNYLSNVSIAGDRDNWSSPIQLLTDLAFDSKLQTQAERRLLAAFPNGLGALAANRRPACLGKLWRDVPHRIPPEELTGIDDWTLFDLLEHRSFDADLANAARNRFLAAGVESISNQLAMPPHVQWNDASPPNVAGVIGLTPTDVADNSVINTIYQASGTLPLSDPDAPPSPYDSAVHDFAASPPLVKKAAQKLLASIEQCPSSDGLNMFAACMLELKQPELAVAPAREAWTIRPSHPYAGVNLVRAMALLPGNTETIERLAREVETTAQLDGWGKQTLEEVRESIRTPMQPKEPTANPSAASKSDPALEAPPASEHESVDAEPDAVPNTGGSTTPSPSSQ
jgi:hypothetical protein